MNKIAIIGTVGVPGNYGGFETLAQNLVDFHGNTGSSSPLSVYCSAKAFPAQPDHYGSARLRYIRLNANGVQSIPYDILSLFDAIRRGDNRLLLLGVSGALSLPLIRLFSRARIVTNIDGIEWKREKWKGIVSLVLRASEWAAVRFSHEVIADNEAIAQHVRDTYGSDCHVIAYGGDHALDHAGEPEAATGLPERYALALCRIEPENNVHTILKGWRSEDQPLVFVGNWASSAYGRDLRRRYGDHDNLFLLDPIYDPARLRTLRDRATLYVHGHSAGGTNPSLVEMMHFGIPVLAHGCTFNRHTTENRAIYFMTSAEISEHVRTLTMERAKLIGLHMREIARRRYTWSKIGKSYFSILER